MEAFYSYTMLIASLAILCALFECLIPQGRLKNVVLFAIGLLFLTGIVRPLVELVNGSAPDLSFPAEIEMPAPTYGDSSYEELLRGYYDRIVIE